MAISSETHTDFMAPGLFSAILTTPGLGHDAPSDDALEVIFGILATETSYLLSFITSTPSFGGRGDEGNGPPGFKERDS